MKNVANSEKRVNVLRRHAGEVKSYKLKMKMLGIGALLTLIPIVIIYLVSALYGEKGNFSISLSKVENQRYGLSISEHADMSRATTQLNAGIAENISNIDGKTLPDYIDTYEGSYNTGTEKQNFIAYTFFLQNSGTVDLSYEYTLSVSNIENNLDEAIRVRIYRNGEHTTYAKLQPPERGGGLEPDADKKFYSHGIVAYERVPELKIGEITRFTVVVWIEGPDLDCKDELIGGHLKLEMKLEVVH